MNNFNHVMRVMRVKILNRPGTFGKIVDAIALSEGSLGDIKVIRVGSRYIIRDISYYGKSLGHLQEIEEEVKNIENVTFIKSFDEVFRDH